MQRPLFTGFLGPLRERMRASWEARGSVLRFGAVVRVLKVHYADARECVCLTVGVWTTADGSRQARRVTGVVGHRHHEMKGRGRGRK